MNHYFAILLFFVGSLFVSPALAEQTVEKPKEESEKITHLPKIDPKAKAPKGVNKRLMSDDISFGYTQENPILTPVDCMRFH